VNEVDQTQENIIFAVFFFFFFDKHNISTRTSSQNCTSLAIKKKQNKTPSNVRFEYDGQLFAFAISQYNNKHQQVAKFEPACFEPQQLPLHTFYGHVSLLLTRALI
jgi:hypothetical protein